MKKIISVLLVLTLTLCCAAPAFAEGEQTEKCDCGITPVVYVCGMGEALFENPGTDDSFRVFSPENKTIVKALPEIIIGVAALLIKSYPVFGSYAIKAGEKLLGTWACDKDGNSLYNVGIEPFDMPEEDTHKFANYEFFGNGADDIEYGEFSFTYDWRLDPIYNAELLKEYVDCVKELTGHDEISFVCHSEGSTIIASYLYKYGSENIDKLVFLAPAYKGISVIGSLFCKESHLGDKSDELVTFLQTMLGYNSTGNLVSSLVSVLQKVGLTAKIFDILNGALDSQFNRVYDEILFNVFITMPGMWSFVPDEYYDKAFEYAFKGKEQEYSGLISKVTEYHENVETKLENLLQEASDNGAGIIIVSGYGVSTLPISPTPVNHSDYLIDTKYTSIGATCSSVGGILGDSYVQKVNDGHNHISGDNVIDASTCAFPDYTWFIRSQTHSELFEGTLHFLDWALTFDGQPTVFDNPDYPQFLTVNDDPSKLVAVTDPLPGRPSNDLAVIFKSIVSLIKE